MSSPNQTAVEALEDLLALAKGEISGPSQVAGIIREAEAVLAALQPGGGAEDHSPLPADDLWWGTRRIYGTDTYSLTVEDRAALYSPVPEGFALVPVEGMGSLAPPYPVPEGFALVPVEATAAFSFEVQLAERLDDPEWRAKWKSDEDGLRSFQTMLNALRADEGDSITLLCDNPDFNGMPNNAVECNGAWTNWKDHRFTGDSLLLAVRAAYQARTVAPTVHQALSGGGEPQAPSETPSNPALVVHEGDLREKVARAIVDDDANWDRWREHMRLPYLQQADRVLALLPLPVSTEGWRPIESAPRDGTRIWLGGWSPNGKWCDAVCDWDTRCAPTIDDDDHEETGFDWPWFQVEPSAWTPLPAPPSSKTEA